jgi:hypothetical protein
MIPAEETPSASGVLKGNAAFDFEELAFSFTVLEDTGRNADLSVCANVF